MDTSHVTVGTAMYMITDCLTYPPKKTPAGAGRRCRSWCRASWPAQGPSCAPGDPQRALVERLGLRVVALGGSNREATPFAPRYKALVTAPQFAR